MTEAADVKKLVLEAVRTPSIIKLADDGRTFAFVPNGNDSYKLENITPPHVLAPPIPKFVVQYPVVQDKESLIAYVNRFKNTDSVLFADIASSHILAVIDYHEAPELADGEVEPRLLAHSATLALPASEEWKTWTGIDGKLMPQLDFVRFIEDNSTDIVAPSAADLIEVCRDMQALRKVNFTNIVRTASNNAEKFEYTNDTNVNLKGGVEFPTAFDLEIPVYFNEAVKPIKARLRWHLDEGALKLGIKLVRPETLRQNTFKSIVDDITTATGLTTVFGKPTGGTAFKSYSV